MKAKHVVTHFVLDCSVTMAWCFEDESTARTERILDLLAETSARVPSIWPLEVANVLLVAERKKRITKVQSANFRNALLTLPISIDTSDQKKNLDTIIELARDTQLSSYDAAYLELAIRESLPICSQDKAVIRAAKKLKIDIF